MQIISNFRDYYDVTLGLGSDSGVTYKRFEMLDDIDEAPVPIYFKGLHWSPIGVKINQQAIGFCGLIYPVVVMEKRMFPGWVRKPCLDISEVDLFVQENCSGKQYQDYMKGGYPRKTKWPVEDQRKYIAKYFDDYAALLSNPPCEWESLFTPSFGPSPVFNICTSESTGKPVLTYGISLKSFEFWRKFDAPQAFQRIETWLASQAHPEKPIPEMSDELKAFGHGYNKWSFRKRPKNGE